MDEFCKPGVFLVVLGQGSLGEICDKSMKYDKSD